MTQLFIELRIARFMFQNITGGALAPEINVFLFALVPEAEQNLNHTAKHCANLWEDVPDNLCRLFELSGLQEDDIDPGFFDSRGCLEDLFLAQFKDCISTRVVAAHRAEFAVDPAKIRHLHQPANDDSITEGGASGLARCGKEFLLRFVFRLKPFRYRGPIPEVTGDI